MLGKRTPLQRANVLIWVGGDALLIWDRRRKKETEIPFELENKQKIPYVPKFHVLWENPDSYQLALRKALGFGKVRILLALPEDITFIETTALEDYVRAALGGRVKRWHGVAVCSHSSLLGGSKGQYIAATRSCRCYCLALVSDGKVVDAQLLDAYRSEHGAFDWAIQEFHEKAQSDSLKVYYPETEEDWTLMSLGQNVPFGKITAMDRPSPKPAGAAGAER